MDIPFLEAKYLTRPINPRIISLVVLHCAEVPPREGAAEWLMHYCNKNDRKASWHYAVDNTLITQSVQESDVAYHAPGANSRGIGIELATFGCPAELQWLDEYHQEMLTLGSWLVAGVCARRNIEPVFVDAQGLKEGRRGITTHAEVSLAFKKSMHNDPGEFFPMSTFLLKVENKLKTGNYETGGT